MSTNQLLVLAVLIVFLITAAQFAGWTVAIICTYLVTLGGVTTVLYFTDGPLQHVGIAPSSLMVSISDVLLLSALIAIWAQGGNLNIGWLLIGFLLPSLVLLLTVWGNTPEQWSGLKLYMTAILAFGIGRWLSENRDDRSSAILTCACLVISCTQFIFTFAQYLGIAIFNSMRSFDSATRKIISDQERMVGLYAHPGCVGKVMFLLLCFLLPLALDNRSITRRSAYSSLILGSFATFITLSRANSAAIVLALVLWPILRGRVSAAVKVLSIAAIGGAGFAVATGFVTKLLLRQESDPDGGPRGALFAAALNQIQSAPLTGTGPNYYVDAVGQYDPYAAQGLPVHNTFLFAVGELGIPLSLLFFFPIMITLRQAARRVGRTRRVDFQSATVFAVAPGLVIAAWTGWGLLQAEILPLWYAAFGFLSSRNTTLVFGERTSGRRDATSIATPINLSRA